MKLKSWFSTSMKKDVEFLWVSSSVKVTHGKISQPSTTRMTRSKATLSRLLILESSSVLKAISMALCIFLIFPGMSLVSRQFVNSRKVMRLKRSFSRLTPSAREFLLALSNWKKIRSPTMRLSMSVALSSLVR